MKADFVSSRVCLGGLPGPLVPGFLGELVTCCGGRRERGGERGGRKEENGGRIQKMEPPFFIPRSSYMYTRWGHLFFP